MSKFVVAATVADSLLKKDATFKYEIVDNNNYIIDEFGGVTANLNYTPQIGDKFTVEVIYSTLGNITYKKRKTFTVKI